MVEHTSKSAASVRYERVVGIASTVKARGRIPSPASRSGDVSKIELDLLYSLSRCKRLELSEGDLRRPQVEIGPG